MPTAPEAASLLPWPAHLVNDAEKDIEELQQAVASLERKVRALEKVAIQHRARIDATVNVAARDAMERIAEAYKRLPNEFLCDKP